MDLITTTSELTAVCARLARHPVITVDTEFLRETTYYPLLCVVQMASAEEAVVIDTLAAGIDLKGYAPKEEVPQAFYAKVPMSLELSGRFHQIAKFAYEIGNPGLDLVSDNRDSAAAMPKSIVVDQAFTWGDDRPPAVPWNRSQHRSSQRCVSRIDFSAYARSIGYGGHSSNAMMTSPPIIR